MPQNSIEILNLIPIADMHCDTISEIAAKRKQGQTIALRKSELHIDLEKMKKAGYLVQNFAMFLYLKGMENPFTSCMEMIDTYKNEIAENSDVIAEAFSYSDIIQNHKQGKMSALLTIEEGEAAMGCLENLRKFYQRGVRMLTLTWNFKNSIGYPNCLKPDGTRAPYGVPNTQQGLTQFGFEFVQEMERLGIIIDVSHLSDAGFYDVLRVTKKPFVASHSNSRAVCPHVRNMTDDMIRKLSERGGVMGMNLCPAFLDLEQDYDKAVGTMMMVVDQIKHIVTVGGEDCIGLGSDFDGISPHAELKDASYMPLLAELMEQQGFTLTTIEKVFYKNVIRVYRDVLQ